MTGQLQASILIPTYNRRDLLLKTLASLEHQALPASRFEVVVSVDGSSDGTVEAIQALSTNYPLRWIAQENRGKVSAINRAAELARHDVLVCLDDDQLAGSDFLAAHLQVHEEGREVLVQGPYPLAEGYDRNGEALLYDEGLRGDMQALASSGATSWHLWGNNFSVTARTWKAVGGFDETYSDYGGEDTDFGLRVSAAGVPFIYEPRAITRHMHHVGYASFRRQAISSGRAVVRLARKHGLRLEDFSGSVTNHRMDALCSAGWERRPKLMDQAGLVLTAGLWLADCSSIRPAQTNLARMVRRYYRLGGVAMERAISVEPAPPAIRIHPTAEVDDCAVVGTGTQIWNQAQVRTGAYVGHSCILGKGVYVDTDVVIGDNVKLENRVSVFKGARLANGVFVGPHSCLLNDKRPRAITADGKLKDEADWLVSGVTVDEGASIGGGCTILPGVHIGRFALVGAGAVVTKDVPDYALVFGNPARIFGYVCECGEHLDQAGTCAMCGRLHTLGERGS